MTIVYFITTVGHGKGGHFHSLHTIAAAIGKFHKVNVINIGLKPSDVLDQTFYDFSFVNFNGFNFLSAFLKIKRLINELQPDAIHAFDVESFAFSRLFSMQRKQFSFLNKCGGPNPRNYFPKPDQLILFSEENEVYFKENNRYKKINTTLIPNRVKPVKVDLTRVKTFQDIYSKSNFSLLRIARIGKHYHESIIQSINLVDWLKYKRFKVRLILIGTIQSVDVYDSILKYIKFKDLEEDIIIETSDEFTHNASELLELGDLIIGTGRNFMEASSINKPLLVPYKDSEYPLLLTDENFKTIFSTNFSPRTQVPDFNNEENLESIYNLLTNKQYQSKSKVWFDTYFNVDKAVVKYLELYEQTKTRERFSYIDIIVNVLYCMKTFMLK